MPQGSAALAIASRCVCDVSLILTSLLCSLWIAIACRIASRIVSRISLGVLSCASATRARIVGRGGGGRVACAGCAAMSAHRRSSVRTVLVVFLASCTCCRILLHVCATLLSAFSCTLSLIFLTASAAQRVSAFTLLFPSFLISSISFISLSIIGSSTLGRSLLYYYRQ